VLKLELASNVKAPRELVNPYSFKEAIAPHIAAEKSGIEIKIAVIQQAFDVLATMADIVIVEGAGGFLVPLNSVPLNNQQNMADLVATLNIPIILVVGMKLGCINHTLLTVEAIKARQLTLHGWVANQLALSMDALEANIETIAQKTQMDCLANYPYKR
jgi:dethiobiotin synthetase